MKKIVVIGSGGAGKSTFSRRLGEITGIEVIHLDKIYWLPDWTEPSKEEFEEILKVELEKREWIMDGNFKSTLELRLEKCDTVISLELPRTVCLYRALKRIFKYRGKTRPDMGEGCNEKIDLEFLMWVWNFPKKDKLKIEKVLEKFDGKVKIIRLKSKSEVEEFLQTMIHPPKSAKFTN